MNLEVIPKKTSKGRVEVETRAFRVGPRERSVLIMVDGKTPAKVLLAQLSFMKKADKILNELYVGGFIETAEAIELPTLPVEGRLSEALQSARQIAHDFIARTLGTRGEYLMLKLGTSHSQETLMPLLKRCREAIQAVAGKQKALDFWMEIELAVKYG